MSGWDQTTGDLSLWDKTKAELQLQLTPDIYERYISTTTAIADESGNLAVICPNTWVQDWLEHRLARPIKRTVNAIAQRDVTLAYVLAPDNQLPLPLTGTPKDPASLLKPGHLRQPGYTRVWHDLRYLYGPMIGLEGIGLWTELRSAVMEIGGHPLNGYTWLGLRAISTAYGTSRNAIPSILNDLATAGLVEWSTGEALNAAWEANKAAGIRDADNAGIPSNVLLRFAQNPSTVRLYTIHDPLELPDFCMSFNLTLVLAAQPRARNEVIFQDYPGGRISARWQEWLQTIMGAQGITTLTPDVWPTLGYSGSQEASPPFSSSGKGELVR